MEERRRLSRARRATRFQFLVLGFVVGTWGTHIPSVSARYALGEAALSVVLFAVALGTVLALFVAGRVIARLGARNTIALFGACMGVSLGFALEYPISRVLCDSRILNIFEGAAEIQAHVIARRLLDGSN